MTCAAETSVPVSNSQRGFRLVPSLAPYAAVRGERAAHSGHARQRDFRSAVVASPSRERLTSAVEPSARTSPRPRPALGRALDEGPPRPSRAKMCSRWLARQFAQQVRNARARHTRAHTFDPLRRHPVPTRRNPRCVKSKHCRGPITAWSPPLAPKTRQSSPASPTPPGRYPIRRFRCWPGQRRPDPAEHRGRAATTPRSRSRGASTGASGARSEPQRSTIKTPRCASSSVSGSAAGRCTSSGSSRRGCFASDFLRWASSRRRICSMMNGGNIGRLFLGFTVPDRDYPS